MIVKLGTDLVASYDSGPQCVAEVEALRVQARLTAFSGQLDIYQGESQTALALTVSSGALVGETSADEHYDLRPSEWVRVIVTRSAGTVNELLLSYTGAGR